MDLVVRKAYSTDVLLLAMEAMIGKMDHKMMKQNPLLNYSVVCQYFSKGFRKVWYSFCKSTSTKKLFRCGIQAEFFE